MKIIIYNKHDMKKNLLKKMLKQNVLLIFFHIDTDRKIIKFNKMKISI